MLSLRLVSPIRMMIVVLGALLLSTMVAALPASATSKSDCTSGNVCLYKDTNFGGGIKLYANDASSYSGNFLNCTWNPTVNCAVDNGASSVYNNGVYSNVRLYSAKSYTGATLQVPRSATYSTFANVDYNDAASSHKWY